MTGVTDPADYLSRLPSLAPALPSGAREFAVDKDHYDFSSSRCVKDLKISGIHVTGDGAALELALRHNCWKHDNDLVIRYQGVRKLTAELTYSGGTPVWTALGEAGRLGEVIVDEILPHQDGCSHEIACWPGTLKVVCRDLAATWIPAGCPGKPDLASRREVMAEANVSCYGTSGSAETNGGPPARNTISGRAATANRVRTAEATMPRAWCGISGDPPMRSGGCGTQPH